jgi:PAS domain S-box-containing protein
MKHLNKSKEELITVINGLQEKLSSLEEKYDQALEDHKKTEKELQSSKQRYHTLIELAVEGILLGSHEGVIIESNKQMSVILGMPVDNILGKHISELPFKKESLIKSPWRFDLVLSGETVISERVFVRPDGAEIVVEIHIKMMPDGTLQSIYLDITERTVIQENLRSSEEKFRKVFMTTPDSITINRLEDGMFISVNKGFIQTTGYSEAEIIGKTSHELNLWVNTADRLKFINLIKTNGSVENFEAVYRSKDGKLNVGLMSAAMMDLKDESHILVITRDINERKQSELLLKAAKERAEESDRLKTAFLQNMSHEIRTPMNSIIGFAGLLADNFHNKEKLKKFTEIINQRSNDLLDIINDILDISKIESGQLAINTEVCNLTDLFDELKLFFDGYQNRIGKNHIDLKNHYLPESMTPHIEVDKGKIRQIFINLISNALKFTDEGTVRFGCIPVANELIFFVSDTGIGIPQDKHKIIFERFAQLKQSAMLNPGGTGLGLPIVKGLLNLMGGKIWLESEPQKGSTFYFTLGFQRLPVDSLCQS